MGGGTTLGGPNNKDVIAFGVLYWGRLNCHIDIMVRDSLYYTSGIGYPKNHQNDAGNI